MIGIVDEGHGKFLFSGSVHVEEMANLMKVTIEGQEYMILDEDQIFAIIEG